MTSREEKILGVVDDMERLRAADAMLWGVWEEYFGADLENEELRKQACEKVCERMEYIAATLWAANNLVFEFIRDMDAALDTKTAPVMAFSAQIRRLYGGFMKEEAPHE